MFPCIYYAQSWPLQRFCVAYSVHVSTFTDRGVLSAYHYKEHTWYEIMDTTNTPLEPSPIYIFTTRMTLLWTNSLGPQQFIIMRLHCTYMQNLVRHLKFVAKEAHEVAYDDQKMLSSQSSKSELERYALHVPVRVQIHIPVTSLLSGYCVLCTYIHK